ncbi:DUF2808 domain-containing protein [Geminocystis sp. NIES-3709]|uniref:DUF2808 domain-containing protein n=1 Tax=Geminocystis sp. NIES-3709 TaxID=1617448 RepID=UPI0005FCC37B|nr:DUF2808 domain-containing protein [Geminocystis sp. NIES-3709]BAQ65263.1 hypothetical protein GM3709_2028 [Geminocystis sp. NIES-3709]
MIKNIFKYKIYRFLLVLFTYFFYEIVSIKYNQNLFISEVLAEEISFFRTSPRLVRSNAVFKMPDVISTYIFEIEIPENADNNLNKVVINQQINLETITFFPEDSSAFIINGKESLIDTDFTLNTDGKNEIIVDLLQPVKAGEKLKLAIKARNPLYGGIYQFGITVYPQGDNPQSLYLGNARFSFDMRGGRF